MPVIGARLRAPNKIHPLQARQHCHQFMQSFIGPASGILQGTALACISVLRRTGGVVWRASATVAFLCALLPNHGLRLPGGGRGAAQAAWREARLLARQRNRVKTGGYFLPCVRRNARVTRTQPTASVEVCALEEVGRRQGEHSSSLSPRPRSGAPCATRDNLRLPH
jgi:hypothetical protein